MSGAISVVVAVAACLSTWPGAALSQTAGSNATAGSNPILAPQAEAEAYNKIRTERKIEAKKKLVLAFERGFPKSNHLPEVYIDWSRALVSQSEFAAAVEYAEKALGAINRIKNSAPGPDQQHPKWQDWINGLESSAKSNLSWTQQMLSWQQQQIRSTIIRKR